MWRSALGMPLGIMAGGTDIASAPPHASREYMRVPGAALAPRDGRYILQMTEELWETGYLDAVKLLAVDHPESVDVYVSEGFVPPRRGRRGYACTPFRRLLSRRSSPRTTSLAPTGFPPCRGRTSASLPRPPSRASRASARS